MVRGERPLALYSLRKALQRDGLADLLGLNNGLISEITERVRLGVAVERSVADQPLAAPAHDEAERPSAAAVGALEEPRRRGLAILEHGEQPLLAEPLLVR